jgi:hypothetical protein
MRGALQCQQRRDGVSEGKPGRPRSRQPLDWRHVINLTSAEGRWLERLAAERDVPVGWLLRHIVREYEAREGNGREERAG